MYKGGNEVWSFIIFTSVEFALYDDIKPMVCDLWFVWGHGLCSPYNELKILL